MGKEDFTAIVIADGKITIPKEQRDIWNVEMGDYITCKIIEVTPSKEVQEKEKNSKKEAIKEETSL